MAKLYVRQHGEQLLDFIRQTEMLENQEDQNNENIWEVEEENIAQASQVDQTENSWSIKTILQWVWNRITLQNTQDNTEEEAIHNEEIHANEDEAAAETYGENSASQFSHSIVALAMLLTVAVMISRTVSK